MYNFNFSTTKYKANFAGKGHLRIDKFSILAIGVILASVREIFGHSVENNMVLGVEKKQSDEERLLEYLFTDYNPSARPVLNSSKTVNVTLMFSLMHIQELVSKIMCFHVSLPPIDFVLLTFI